MLVAGKRQEINSACRSPDTATGLGCEPTEQDGARPGVWPCGRQGFPRALLKNGGLMRFSQNGWVDKTFGGSDAFPACGPDRLDTTDRGSEIQRRCQEAPSRAAERLLVFNPDNVQQQVVGVEEFDDHRFRHACFSNGR